jgi:hypothetical protein
MSRPIEHVVLICFLITVAPWFSPASAQPQADTSADARLRALYTEEWNWRQEELRRGDAASDVRYRTYEAPFNSDTFFWTDFTPRQGFATAEAYRSYLARLSDVPRYFDEADRQHARGPGAWLHGTARVGARPRSRSTPP